MISAFVERALTCKNQRSRPPSSCRLNAWRSVNRVYSSQQSFFDCLKFVQSRHAFSERPAAATESPRTDGKMRRTSTPKRVACSVDVHWKTSMTLGDYPQHGEVKVQFLRNGVRTRRHDISGERRHRGPKSTSARISAQPAALIISTTPWDRGTAS